MAMNAVPRRRRWRPPPQLLRSDTLVVVGVVVLLQLASIYPCATSQLHHHHSPSAAGMLVGEKTRLGSRPPSCHNRCSRCHPCMPVQVPPLPSPIRVESTEWLSPPSSGELDSSMDGSQLSDYKPLEWKCHCKGHFYNP